MANLTADFGNPNSIFKYIANGLNIISWWKYLN